MSAHRSVQDLPSDGERLDAKKLAFVKNLSLLVGVACVGVTWVLLFFGSRFGEAGAAAGDMASYSYLFAIIFFLTIGMGGLFWTLLHHATNSGWGIVVRRQMENIAGILPWVFVLMIPFWFPQVRSDLYEWEVKLNKLLNYADSHVEEHLDEKLHKWEETRAELETRVQDRKDLIASVDSGEATAGELATVREQLLDTEDELAHHLKKEPTEDKVFWYLMKDKDPLLAHKYRYHFNASYLRFALYIIVFVAIVYLLRKWSLETDRTGDVRYFLRSRYWGSFFLLPFAVGFTFLVIDFLMALNYTWFSTMWGVYLFAGAALSSMAALILVVTILRNLGYLDVVTPEHYHLMGKLLFAFCVFWAYISFSQFFLIWYANITEETTFFLLRNSEGWNSVSTFLVIGHFFLPFVILLWRPVKKAPAALAAVSVWILLMHVLDVYWIVIPERSPSLGAGGAEIPLFTPGAILLDALALVGVGAIMVFIFIEILSRSSLYPCRDPRLEESMNAVN